MLLLLLFLLLLLLFLPLLLLLLLASDAGSGAAAGIGANRIWPLAQVRPNHTTRTGAIAIQNTAHPLGPEAATVSEAAEAEVVM